MESIFPLKQTEPNVIQLEAVFIIGLVLITLIALLVKRLRFPYTVALVFAGLLLAVLPTGLTLELGSPSKLISSELILALFVPPLVFEGAIWIDWRKFRENLIPILLMAVVGVFLGTFIVGGMIVSLSQGFETIAETLGLSNIDGLGDIPFSAAIAFGALISATDPVAVITFFRSLGVDKRLSILIEGESLLNDGTSIVIFNLALAVGGAAALAHGTPASIEITLPGIIWEFGKVSIGGVIAGWLSGLLAAYVMKRTDARLVETTITIALAFGAYVLAEIFHLSGILSVVAAGITLGSVLPAYTTPTTRIVLYNFWEVLSFIVTSLIFLVIGWIIDIRQFITVQNLLLVFAAVFAILVSRFIVVYGMSALTNFGLPLISNRGRIFHVPPIPRSYQHVMYWGGLRGAISLALALSLAPNAFGPGIGSQLQFMTFGAVLFTLVVQGTTIERLIKRLGLASRSERDIAQERSFGRYYSALAGQQELKRLHEDGIYPPSLWKVLEETQKAELMKADQNVRDLLQRFPGMSIDLALQARRSVLNAQRIALGDAARKEIISEGVQDELVEELDSHLGVLDRIAEQVHSSPGLYAEGEEE
jgi:CPA1 family monovalent cation:H+ antiporter